MAINCEALASCIRLLHKETMWGDLEQGEQLDVLGLKGKVVTSDVFGLLTAVQTAIAVNDIKDNEGLAELQARLCK